MGDVVKHIPKDDLCPFCKKKESTLLCDMPVNTVITHARGSGFKSYTMTCDKKICTECTTKVNGFDFCPDCVKRIKITPKGGKEGWRIDFYPVESGLIMANGYKDIYMVSGREDISYGE